jgi:thioredoxin-related protein
MKFTTLALVFLLAFNFARAQDDVPTAESIMNTAYQQASKENKNVILMFHASWCGWCRKMDAAINDKSCKKLFDENYVIVHLTVEESKDKKYLENPGADSIKMKFHGEQAGLPFWLVLDKNGKLIGDSYIRKPGISKDQPGENIGCPASEKEIAAFIEILRKSSSLTDKQLDKIAERFSKNKPIPPAH